MSLLERARKVAREQGMSGLVRKVTKRGSWKLFGYAMAPVVQRRLRKRMADVKTFREALDLSYSFSSLGLSIAPFQIREEIERLCSTVQERKPAKIVEIGTGMGGTLFLLARSVPENAAIVSIDLPHGNFGRGYPKCAVPLLQSFARKGQRVSLIRADSHSPETHEKTLKEFGGGPIDFLFIDGDHSYEGVKKDFEMYSPLVRKGGLIAFHDICPGDPEQVGGVPDYWKEVSRGRNAMSIVKDKDQKFCGIGLLEA